MEKMTGKFLLLLSVISIASAGDSNFSDYVLYKMQIYEANAEGPDAGGVSQVLTLTQHVISTYMNKCNLLVVFHSSFKFESKAVNFDVTTLFRNFSQPFAFTKISKKNKVPDELLRPSGSRCRGFIVFINDVALTVTALGDHPQSKVVVVTASTAWKITEYLQSSEAKGIVNFLVIATTGSSDIIIRRGEKSRSQRFLNLYTHDLYTDGYGNSRVRLLTSWKENKPSRNVNFFPRKLSKGFNGRQFAVVASEQPPYVIKRKLAVAYEADTSVLWDGVELRLLRLLSEFLNYTIKVEEADPTTITRGPAEVAVKALSQGLAEISVAGIYRSNLSPNTIAYSSPHSVDCATFVTRSSTALPRYRAILGPFHWHVWLALTVTYFIAIIPLTFAEKHSLSYLWHHPWHMETMFWYVFGTFTNCFTFRGENSWTKSEKNASRMLIGWYWAFSIIVTACYTGSIIAFITLFVYPPVIDSLDQLLEQDYRIGSLSTGGWGQWFNNSDHPQTKWLLRDIELVPNITQGLKNVTKSYYLPFLRPYAFLASKAHLEYIIRTNFTLTDKKAVLYPSRNCFVPFGVSIIYPSNAPYRYKFDEFILRAQQSGLIAKLHNQMNWELQRSSTGKLLQAGSGISLRDAITQDRRLTLDDTQGMFLLLGAGFLMALTALFFEKSGHHQAEARSWKFWLFLPHISLDRIITGISNFIPERLAAQLPDEICSVDDDFTFKTYDSRVLRSHYNNIHPSIFLSEPELQKSRQLMRTHSLPDFHIHLTTNRSSQSCHNVGRQAADVVCKISDATSTERPITFGSVGSILMAQHYREKSMMASKMLWLEILKKTVENDVKTELDRLVVIIHYTLIGQDFVCIGVGDSKTLSEHDKRSELLPPDWNANQDSYHLRYLKNDEVFLASITKSGDDAIFSLISTSNLKVTSLIISHSDVVNIDKSEETIIGRVRKEFFDTSSKDEVKRRCHILSEPPSTGRFLPTVAPPMYPQVGRGDLDPFARGPHSGMIFDPNKGMGRPLLRHDPIGPFPYNLSSGPDANEFFPPRYDF